MKRVIEATIVASVVLLLGGCATKKYVAQQTDPITAKVNEVGKQAQSTQKQLESDEPKISAAAEKAATLRNVKGAVQMVDGKEIWVSLGSKNGFQNAGSGCLVLRDRTPAIFVRSDPRSTYSGRVVLRVWSVIRRDRRMTSEMRKPSPRLSNARP